MKKFFLALVLAGSLASAGCGTHALEGGAVGAALGAATGAGVAAITGSNVGYGAIAGAAAGALGGGLAGSQNTRPYDGSGYVNPFTQNSSSYRYTRPYWQNASGYINRSPSRVTRWYSTD